MKNFNYFIFSTLTLTFFSCSNVEQTDNAQLEADISPVISKIGGTVTKIMVDDNQFVQAGDTLLLLDDAALKIAVNQAEVALALARQQVIVAAKSREAVSGSVNTALANSNTIASSIYTAKASEAAARVKLDVTSKSFLRVEQLYKQSSATLQQYDNAKAEKEGAEQALRIAEGQLLTLQKQIEASQVQTAATKTNVFTSSEQVALAQLAVKQAEHQLDNARLQLSYCTIIAAADGIVTKKSVQIGQVVALGQPLMAVTGRDKAWVVANFKETQLENMKEGQEAEISINAYNGKAFKGKVVSMSQATGARFSLLPPDNATGNFVKVTQRVPVKIEFLERPDDAFVLRAGMSVSVKVKTLKP